MCPASPQRRARRRHRPHPSRQRERAPGHARRRRRPRKPSPSPTACGCSSGASKAADPQQGEIGIAPEWFYKGDGSVLRAPFEPLAIPGLRRRRRRRSRARRRLSHRRRRHARTASACAAGNEFSDHKFEKRNYLNLAGSKLRTCSLGPELVIGADFDDVPGEVAHRARRADPLAEDRSPPASKHVPQPRQPRAPSLQVRGPPPARHRPRALLWRRRSLVRRRHRASRRRHRRGQLRRLRPCRCAIRSDRRTESTSPSACSRLA